MILSRAPLRISLGGGGTDLPDYARAHGGFVVSAAIDRYVYLAAHRPFEDLIRLAYSRTEIVRDVERIEHPIFREALKAMNITKRIELVSIADLPANSGLGSSSTFTVALMNALHAYARSWVSREQLAELAAQIEIERLGEPIGRQDHYASAVGGIVAMTFSPDGSVLVDEVPMSARAVDELQSRLMIFYTGQQRPANDVLRAQGTEIREGRALERMHKIKALGRETWLMLTSERFDDYGHLLHEHWIAKRAVSPMMSDGVLDAHYAAARGAGAVGGKLLGAGGGGFFLLYVRPQDKTRVYETMVARGLAPLGWRFDFQGATIVTNLGAA